MFRSILSYGGPGVGKTAFGVSSFWDYIKKEPVEGQTGRLLLIGRESNPDLDIPEELIKWFPIERSNPLKFVANLKMYLISALALAKKGGDHPTNLVLDGFSELGLEYLWGYVEENPNDKETWGAYRELKRDLTEIMLMFNPKELKANLFATARVTKYKQNDPEWMKVHEYHPALDGFWRDNLGHYFNNIVYHEATYKVGVKGGKPTKTPVWLSHWLVTGDYMVKNTAAHKWPLEATLENASWPEVRAALENM